MARAGLVHVWKGRNNHLACGDYWKMRTLCGMPWVATVIGPPSSERPLCTRCERKADA